MAAESRQLEAQLFALPKMQAVKLIASESNGMSCDRTSEAQLATCEAL
jgi:hypothetical protein